MKRVAAGIAFSLIAVSLAAFEGIVLSPAGEPIAGASIVAYRPETDEAQLDRVVANAKRAVLAKTKSDAKGAFTLPLSGHGLVVVAAEASGFAPTFTTREINDASEPVVMQRAEFRDGSIAASGHPVAGARVIVLAGDGDTEARTDDRGRFRINGLDGARKVLVLHPDFAPVSLEKPSSGGFELVPGTTFTGKVLPAAVARIQIDSIPRGLSTADGTFSIEHVDPRARMISAETDDASGETPVRPRVAIAMKRGVKLSGVVRDSAGRPLSGIPLTLARDGIDLLHVVSDEWGAYTFRHLTPDPASIRIGCDQWTAEKTDVDLREDTIRDLTGKAAPLLRGTVKLENGAPVLGATVTVMFPNPKVEPRSATTDARGHFRIPLAQGGPIDVIAVRRGLPPVVARVKAGAALPLTLTIGEGIEVTGRVADAAGSPLAGVTIAVAGLSVPWGETRTDGTFSVRLPRGEWALLFSKEGLLDRALNNVHVPALAALNVALQPAFAIRGRVSRHDGTPVGGIPFMIEGLANATSGGDGRFEMNDLPKGRHRLRYEAFGNWQDLAVTAPSEDVVIELPETGSVRGRVVDETGAPVTDFAIDSDDISSEDGTFEKTDIPAGAFRFTVRADGYVNFEKHMIVEGSKIADAGTIVLRHGRTIRGVVTSAAGAPLAEATVSPGSFEAATAGEDGGYELSSLDFGVQSIRFAKEGFVPVQRMVAAGEGDVTLNVELAPALAVTGHVVNADGTPAAEAEVDASSESEGAQYENVVTDGGGAFRFPSLVPGRYDFEAVDQEKRLSGTLKDIDVTRVRDVTIRLRPPTNATISGSLTGIDLTAAPVRVMLYALDRSPGPSTNADASGNYRLENVPAGFVTVWAVASAPVRATRHVTVEVKPNAHLHVDLVFPPRVDVHGRITRGGKPVGGTRVLLWGRDDLEFVDDADVFTEEDGTFAASLTEGSYDVHIGDWPSLVREIRGGEPLDIALDPVRISVTVVDAQTAAPIAGAKVSAPDDRGQTDANGQLTFEAAEMPARIRVAMEGYAGANVEGKSPAIVKLTRADGALVRLVDARDGRTLTGDATARDAAGHLLASGSRDGPDGSLRIAVAPGTYRFSGFAAGYGSATVTAEVPSNEVRIPLPRAGRLILVSSSELRGTARLIQPDGEEYVRCWCDGEPEIRISERATLIDSVAPGTYTLEITPNGGKARQYPVSVIEGQMVTVAIQ